MDSSNLWLAGSLVLGIVMIFIGLLLIALGMPLAKGQVRAHEYNYRPWQPIKLSGEESDRLGKPTAKAAIGVAMLYVLSGLTSIGLGATGNAGPVVLYLFLGTIVLSIVAFAAIMIVSILAVKRVRQKEAKPPAS